LAPDSIKRRRLLSRPWTSLRKLIQALALLTFLALFVAARGENPGSTTNLFLRLDPLPALVNLLASRALVSGVVVALITVALTFLTGRSWCGWLCPLGTILDWIPLYRWKKGKRTPGEGWRGVKYALLLLTLFAALLGGSTLLIFDPLTILTRGLAVGVWPALDKLVTAAETALYQLPALRAPILEVDALLRPLILPPVPVTTRASALFAGILMAVVLLNLFAERFWCRYLCPLGALLGLMSKIALLRRRIEPGCLGCKLCTAACPMGTIQPSDDYASDPGECTMCMECLDDCPLGVTTFKPGFGVDKFRSYDPGRRQSLITLGAALGGMALIRSVDAELEHPFGLRPPGADPEGFYSQCVRCGQCMRACPTAALQPALAEAGIEGFWTPVLIPRLGYCDYGCNACGQSCPVEAIPPLPLEHKQQQVIGRAKIDKNRCLPWAEEQDCIVCEEMCPLPEKAIELELVEVHLPTGETRILQRPVVIHDLCIGCGVCEYKCPVAGDAAIRVYSHGSGRGGSHGQGQHRGG
jgi:polyferredoxin